MLDVRDVGSQPAERAEAGAVLDVREEAGEAEVVGSTMRRRNYGNCVVRSASLLNLGRCPKCGTHNPTEPGAGLAEKCSGCGERLPTHTLEVGRTAFRPPKGKR